MKRIAGIDIGGTKTAIAVADTAGTILEKRVLATNADPKLALPEIASEVQKAVSSVGGSLVSAGIACCGPLDLERGLVLRPPNLHGWDRVDLVGTLASALGAPVALENDANAAAIGEHKAGAARGFDDVLYVTVSTGIGGGVIVGGKLIHGVGGGAGELGHMTVCVDGPLCGCGQKGCLEAVSSGSAIARQAKQALELGRPSILRQIKGEISARDVIVAVSQGDRLSAEVWSQAIRYLAMGLANAIVVIAPAVVVIGGGIATVGEQLFGPLREQINRRISILPAEQVQIKPAELGSESALYGAVSLAKDSAIALAPQAELSH